MRWAGQREQRRECVFLPVAFPLYLRVFLVSCFMPSVTAFFFSYYFVYGPVPRVSCTLCAVTKTHLMLWLSVCVCYASKGRNVGPLWSRPFTHSDLQIRTDLRGLQLRRKMYYPRLLDILSFQNVQRPPDLQPTPLRFLLFSPRLLRSQLSLTVIARMLGQQEALPLWGEKTQVSLPQQDQEGLWWATTLLPLNLLTPEL